MTRIDRLAADAKGQHGIILRRQANAGGVSDATLRRRVQSGNLDKIGVRTFASPLADRTALADVCALMLDVGDPVWIAGPTAAAIYSIAGYVLRPPFHLLTLRDRSVRRAGHVIHTTTRLDLIDREACQGLAVTSPSRTLIDLVRMKPPRDVDVVLESALLKGLTTEDFLHERIASLRGKGSYGIPRLLAALERGEIKRGGTTWLERRFLSVLAGRGLPRPETQVVLSRAGDKLIRVDFHYRDKGIVIEVLGYRWHRTKAQMNRDAERANRLLLEGNRVLQFTYDDVVSRAESVLDVVDALLAMA